MSRLSPPLTADSAAVTPSPDAKGHWFLNPYLQIGLGALSITVAELALRVGSRDAPDIAGLPWWSGIAALANGWTWLGILTYILSFISWIIVLKRLALSVAFGLISIVHVLVPIAALICLHEAIHPRRWLGIGLVLAGILLISGLMTQAEERL